MSTVIVVGTQWGDEGKGKITDFLAESAHYVARYQGGDNAGHTIQFDGIEYKLHLIPSGIFYPNKICVIGNGLVVNPLSLIKEIKYLHDHGISTDNLKLSGRAHVIMPYHLKLDELEENSKGINKIGTTKKGIGPSYVDKAARVGIRIVDLMDPVIFREKLEQNLAEKNKVFTNIYQTEGFVLEDIYQDYIKYAEILAPYVTETSLLLNDAIDEGKNVLFEGAQGVLLDIDQGTYPFVTSSSPSAGGVCSGSGVGPTKINRVVGVAKAYTTRVGDGPFPTEIHNQLADHIREIGREYGTTTGRPRRIGWFDTVVIRHARRVSGITDLSLNSIDVLTGIKTLKICTAYKYQNELINYYPSNLRILSEVEAVYEELPGWDDDITGVKKLEDLPINARHYLEKIEALTGIKLTIFSVGPDREQTNLLRPIY